MQMQEGSELRTLSAEELDAVAGGSALVEVGKIVLGWVIGKVLDSEGGRHPYAVLKDWKAWQEGLGK
jgi:hypothetical protein